MLWLNMLQPILLIGLLVLLVKPMGTYMFHVFTGERTFMDPLLKPVERLMLRLVGTDPDSDMRWTTYAFSVLMFNLVGIGALYAILRLQGILPLNPNHFAGASPDLAFNVAVSMVTHTNWQSYAGESTLSNLSQMMGVVVQQFVAACVSLSIAVALIRGIVSKQAKEIGNFWVDLTRSVLYVALPVAVLGALFLASQGVPQTLAGQTTVKTLEGVTQTIRLGPVASAEIIKDYGTTGGGFFNANAAHPFENPTPLTNFFEMLVILLVPAAGTYMFGKFVGNTRQGWVLFIAMLVLYVASFGIAYSQERAGNPLVARAGVSLAQTSTNPGGNMEGKEVRFGVTASTLYNVGTTTTSCGATNASIDSFMPLAGGVAMFNIALGEVIWGGFGQGLFSMLVFVALTVFIGGLMVGRTPEYLGKKIETREIKLGMIAVLSMNAGILLFSAVAVSLPAGLAGRLNLGPHGMSEIMYAFTQAIGNNGSAMGGLSSNTVFFNSMLGAAMLVGRFFFVLPVLAIAGSFAGKKVAPQTVGTLPTDSAMFVILLIAVIFIVGALSFLPAFTLGPILEHFLLHAGRLF
jgi:K+-transporting ATPase ATPase A chain